MARARSNYSGKPKSWVQYISESRRAETRLPLPHPQTEVQSISKSGKVEALLITERKASHVYQKVDGQKPNNIDAW